MRAAGLTFGVWCLHYSSLEEDRPAAGELVDGPRPI